MSQIKKRNEIVTLWNSNLHNPKQISLALDVSLATVYLVIRRISQQQSLDHRQGTGRPAKVFQYIKRSIIKQITDDPKISIREITSRLPSKASKTSVHRCLNRMDYSKPLPIKVPMLSETNRVKRLEWASSNLNRH